MTTKIIKHFMTANNNPAVEYERVDSDGEVRRGKALTHSMSDEAVIAKIEKHGTIADKFASAGELVDEIPYGSLAWRMNAEAGTLKDPLQVAEPEQSKQPTSSKPPKPQKVTVTPSSTQTAHQA